MGLIYLDTCLLIYLVEDRDGRGAAVERSMQSATDARFAISPLVRLEAYVKPLRDGDMMLHRRYERATSHYALLSLDVSAYDQAALLRARFGLRTPDALHLACAQLHDCTALWTNDQRLHNAAHGLAVEIEHDDG